MNNNETTLWFALISLFNTSVGLSNVEKNIEEEKRQQRIEKKLDKILEFLDGKQ